MNLKNLKKEQQHVLPGFPESKYEYFERCTKEEEEGNLMKCWACKEFLKEGDSYLIVEVYDSPFDTASKELVVHVENEDKYNRDCYSLLFDRSYYDFGYFHCDICDRNIITRCPSNGWHEYSRYVGDGELEICLRCYEEDILENGMSRESFEEGRIDEMFVSDQDLVELEWEKVCSSFINSKSSAERYCKEAIEWIDKGYRVLNEYERMAIGGLEGTINMWVKRKETDHEKDSAQES